MRSWNSVTSSKPSDEEMGTKEMGTLRFWVFGHILLKEPVSQ